MAGAMAACCGLTFGWLPSIRTVPGWGAVRVVINIARLLREASLLCYAEPSQVCSAFPVDQLLHGVGPFDGLWQLARVASEPAQRVPPLSPS